MSDAPSTTRLRQALQALCARLAAKAFPLTPHDTAEACITLCDLQGECKSLLAAQPPALAEPPPYPRPCGLCPGQIESEADLDWHGLGNCVPICERCTGSGVEQRITAAQPPPRDWTQVAHEIAKEFCGGSDAVEELIVAKLLAAGAGERDE